MTQVAMTPVDDHPWSGPSEMPYIKRPSPMPPSTKPGTSKRPASMASTFSKTSAPKRTATMPMGTLTKNTQRHEKLVTRKPPSTGPTAGATVVPRVRMLAARTRSAGGKTR